MWWILWIGAALLLGLVELATVDLFFLTLAIGAFGTGIFAVFGFPIWTQVVFFTGLSLLLLVLVRPWARNLLARSTPDTTTNVQAYVGKVAVVTAPLVGLDGRVRIGGEDWSARGQDGHFFPVGATVRVVRIDGATAVVGPRDEYVPVPADSEPPEK